MGPLDFGSIPTLDNLPDIFNTHFNRTNTNLLKQRIPIANSFANEQNKLRQQQLAKGINNPQSLIDLQAKLRTKQITPQQFTQQFQAASKGARGATGQNQPAPQPFKITPAVVAGSAVQAAKTVLPSIAQSTVRAIPEAGASVQQLLTGKPTTLQPNKAGSFLFGKAPIQSIQEEAKGAQQSHPGGFKIPGIGVKLTPKETGLAEAGIHVAQDVPVIGGLAKTATKTAGKVAEDVATVAGKDQTVNDLIKNTQATNAIETAQKSAPAETKTTPSVTPQPVKGKPVDNVKPAEITTPNPSIKEKPNVAQSSPTPQGVPQTAPKAGLGEAGGIAPGQAVKDVQDMIDKHQQVTKGSEDISKGLDINQGMQKDIKLDAASVLKNRTKLSPEEHQQIQDYRDAKAAGLTPQELPAHLQKEDAHITQLNAAAQKADAEAARLSGNLEKATAIEKRNPETYTPRLAKGKGTSLDYLLQGERQNPLSVGGLSKTTAGSNKRTFMAATDEAGNRRVISIKTQKGTVDSNIPGVVPTGQKFTKPNQIVAFENGKPTETLGSIPSKVNMVGKTFKGRDGKTYTIGEATQSEVTKHAGQEYHVDPKLAAVKNYAEARTALENTRFIENTKKTLENKNLAVKEGETAPKGFKPTSNIYFRGYKFDPKVREVLDDAAFKQKQGLDLLNKVGRTLRQTIVYLPIKHDLNELAFHQIDRGLSSLMNPMAYGRWGLSLKRAAQDVIGQKGVYKQMLRSGSHLMSADDKQLGKIISKQLKEASGNKDFLAHYAKAVGTSPVRLYNAIQKASVWDIQDILNVARVHERMMPKLGGLKKGMSFEDAVKDAEKFALQYKVPTRVGVPGKAGRSLAQTLKSPKVFFGPYTYDKYRVTKNIVKGAINPKTLVTTKGKANIQAADKLAVMVLGASLAWPVVEKGIQKVTGDKAAHMTAPGPLAVPQTAMKVAKGTQDAVTAAKNQLSLSGIITTGNDLLTGRNSFTGKLYRDPNAPLSTQGKQTLGFLGSQLAPVQKAKGGQNAGPGKKIVGTGLSLAGASLPKNSPEATKLYSLQYDTLPMITAQAKAQAKKGDFKGAAETIKQYDEQVMKAAQADAKAQGKPVPSEKSLKAAGIFYQPKQSTIKNWASGKKTKADAFVP